MYEGSAEADSEILIFLIESCFLAARVFFFIHPIPRKRERRPPWDGLFIVMKGTHQRPGRIKICPLPFLVPGPSIRIEPFSAWVVYFSTTERALPGQTG